MGSKRKGSRKTEGYITHKQCFAIQKGLKGEIHGKGRAGNRGRTVEGEGVNFPIGRVVAIIVDQMRKQRRPLVSQSVNAGRHLRGK